MGGKIMAVTAKYNDYTLPFVDGKFSFHEDEKTLFFSCEFIITSTTYAGLVSDCQTAETKLTEINKDFYFTYGGTTEWDLKHSDSTGFLARPTLTKLTTDISGGVTRGYKFSVEIQLPFTQTPYNYQREGSFDVDYFPNRQRLVNFSCLYTAGGGNSALQNYQAGTGGKVWAAAILLALDATASFELISEKFEEEREEKILNAHLVYKEIIANQATGVENNIKIVDPDCNFSVVFGQEIGLSTSNYDAKPVTTVRVDYRMKCDVEQTTENGIEEVYQDTVKPYLIDKIYGILGLSNYKQTGFSFYVVQNESKTVNPYTYEFIGQLTLSVPKSRTQIIFLSETFYIDEDSGIIREKFWDGQPYTQNLICVGADRTARRVVTISQLNQEPSPPIELPPEDGGFWVEQRVSKNSSRKKLGEGTKGTSLNQHTLYSVTFITSCFFIRPVNIPSVQQVL